jgi:hypothetical protein
MVKKACNGRLAEQICSVTAESRSKFYSNGQLFVLYDETSIGKRISKKSNGFHRSKQQHYRAVSRDFCFMLYL